MKLILRKAYIIDPTSKWHKKRADILIDKGIITTISKTAIKTKAKHEFSNVYVSGGWLDIGTHAGQPGFEHRETAESLAATAQAGGFTGLAIMPDLSPVIDNSTSVNFIQSQSSKSVHFYPLAALSKGLNGEEITEFYDMSLSGAVGFTNGIQHAISKAMLLRALDYAKGFEGLIIHHPADHDMIHKSQMHEGDINVQLGLKGSPDIFEKIVVDETTSLAHYSQSKLLLHLISSKLGLDAFKSAKKKQSNLFASVSYKHLVASDEDLLNFNAQWKIQPPLRAQSDRKALIKAVKDGTLDIISSNHVPLEKEMKAKEFSETSKGAIGLQTLFPKLNIALKDSLSLEEWIPCLSNNPYRVLGLEAPKIEEKSAANLTIFDPAETWTFNQESNLSKSDNSPYFGEKMTGKVIATIYNQTISINQ